MRPLALRETTRQGCGQVTARAAAKPPRPGGTAAWARTRTPAVSLPYASC
ncbi:hypothetical protein SALBM135S_02977 [Streptomyces alboniger]